MAIFVIGSRRTTDQRWRSTHSAELAVADGLSAPAPLVGAPRPTIGEALPNFTEKMQLTVQVHRELLDFTENGTWLSCLI